MKNDFHSGRTSPRPEIGGWVARYRESGFSLGAFAKKHGLPRGRLPYRVYGQRTVRLGQPLVAPPVFQELKLAPGLPVWNWAVEISLLTGPVVRLGAAASPSWR